MAEGAPALAFGQSRETIVTGDLTLDRWCFVYYNNLQGFRAFRRSEGVQNSPPRGQAHEVGFALEQGGFHGTGASPVNLSKADFN
jgi:hypothetical protein